MFMKNTVYVSTGLLCIGLFLFFLAISVADARFAAVLGAEPVVLDQKSTKDWYVTQVSGSVMVLIASGILVMLYMLKMVGGKKMEMSGNSLLDFGKRLRRRR